MKYCTHCGNPLQDSDAFCSNCGASAANNNSQIFTPASQPEQDPNKNNYHPASYDLENLIDPAVAEENRKNATRALVFGILGIVFCYVPLLGIIFACIAMATGKKVLNNHPTGAAKVLSTIGNILGIVGLAFSVLYTVLWILYFLCIIFIVFIFTLPSML